MPYNMPHLKYSFNLNSLKMDQWGLHPELRHYFGKRGTFNSFYYSAFANVNICKGRTAFTFSDAKRNGFASTRIKAVSKF